MSFHLRQQRVQSQHRQSDSLSLPNVQGCFSTRRTLFEYYRSHVQDSPAQRLFTNNAQHDGQGHLTSAKSPTRHRGASDAHVRIHSLSLDFRRAVRYTSSLDMSLR